MIFAVVNYPNFHFLASKILFTKIKTLPHNRIALKNTENQFQIRSNSVMRNIKEKIFQR